MFASDSDTFISKTVGAWFLFSLFLTFAAGLQSSILTVPVVIAIVLLTVWSLDCAYRNERFSRFLAFRLFTALGFSPLIASVTVLAIIKKETAVSPVFSFALALAPMAITVVAFLIVYVRPSEAKALIVSGQKAEIQEVVLPRRNNVLLGGVAAGVGSMLYPLFSEYNVSFSLLVPVLMACSLYMVFYCRAAISALRELSALEVRERRYFTFANADEIRERRRSTLLGRLFSLMSGR